jgi:enoyl-CoA hydratase/carnithine racemase
MTRYQVLVRWKIPRRSLSQQSTATRLAEINLGVMLGMGGTQRLRWLMGKGRALERCAAGKTIVFEEASEMGLVQYVFNRDLKIAIENVTGF